MKYKRIEGLNAITNIPSLVREGCYARSPLCQYLFLHQMLVNSSYARSPLWQYLSLLPTLVERFQFVREKVEKLAPTSILPHKGGCKILICEDTPSLVREGWDGFRSKKMKLKLQDDVSNKSKKVAFTLAEVLITLGIIGVVAALTIPTLLANYEKKKTATAVKKAYSELSQALQMAELDYGDMQYWDYPNGDGIDANKAFVNKYITPYYKGVTMLKDGMNPSSWASGISDTGINFISSNGTIFSGKPNHTKAFYVLVDVNGFKKPNKMGTDIFYFNTRLGKLMPDGWQDGLTREMILDGYNSDYGGKYTCKTARGENEDDVHARHGCTALLMIDGWEFKRDYPWKYTGSGSY